MFRDRTKHLPYLELRKELFYPSDATNVESYFLMEELGLLLASTMLSELRDNRKAAHNHLSSLGGAMCWERETNAEKEAGIGTRANNDISESSFGGMSDNLKKHGMISLANAGAMSLARQNGDFDSELLLAKNKTKGVFCFVFIAI